MENHAPERIKQGIIVSWTLYAVEFTGSSDSYNYVELLLIIIRKPLKIPGMLKFWQRFILI